MMLPRTVLNQMFRKSIKLMIITCSVTVTVFLCNSCVYNYTVLFTFSDPEFVAYDIPYTRLQCHRIKPALFDLFLGLAIVAYGFMWYLFVSVSFFYVCQ